MGNLIKFQRNKTMYPMDTIHKVKCWLLVYLDEDNHHFVHVTMIRNGACDNQPQDTSRQYR